MATWIALLALLLGVVAIAYAWKLQQELATATRRLDRYNRALFDAGDELRRLREALAETAAQLRVEIKRSGQSNEPLFQPTTTIREAGLLHPQAQQVMAGLHLGGCSSCAVEPEMTLAQACAEHGVDLEQLLRNLNLLVGGTISQQTEQPLLRKLPNIELVEREVV
jgi:hypothetical protein